MAIGTLTMIMTNVGLALYNNWKGSNQNVELQQRKEDFDLALANHHRERMFKLMREGQDLSLRIEKERHEQHIQDVKEEFDNMLNKMAFDTTLANWPLRVLPMVMKNQTFGNLLAKQEESVALHCIFAPSNSLSFNRTVLPSIEHELQDYCNNNWCGLTSHPVLFYSGAWNSINELKGEQINLLKNNLSRLPTLLITPYFRPSDGKLVFYINLWGICATHDENIETNRVIEPLSPEEFKHLYSLDNDYDKEQTIVKDAIDDIVPYVKCLVGYFADIYFWSAFGISPLLPSMIKNKLIDINTKEYLFTNTQTYYTNLLLASIQNYKNNPFQSDNITSLFDGCSTLFDDEDYQSMFDQVFLAYCYRQGISDKSNSKDALLDTNWLNSDLESLISLKRIAKGTTKQLIESIIEDKNSSLYRYYFLNSFDDSLFIHVRVDDFDLYEVIEEFERYISDLDITENQKDNFCLLIENKNYQLFRTHLYDLESKCIVRFEKAFDYSYSFRYLKRKKNVQSIFSKTQSQSIFVKLNRLSILKERLTQNIF